MDNNLDASNAGPGMANGATPTSLPGVGAVAIVDEPNLSPTLVGFNSKDVRSRSFNLLRAQFIKKLAETGARLVGITSPAPNAGKSFVASNLAASLSQLSNKTVFLIDLDLRRASIGEIFGIDDCQGIGSYLTEASDNLAEIGRQIGETNLTVYITDTVDTSSAELMVSARMESLLNQCRALTPDSIILFDLPPVFANDDAMLVAEKLDGVLLVVEQGVTNRKQLQGALQLLHPTPVLGTVLNRFDGAAGDIYGYGGKYDRYYGA